MLAGIFTVQVLLAAIITSSPYTDGVYLCVSRHFLGRSYGYETYASSAGHADTIDLEELERCFIDSRTISTTVRKIIDHWSVVRSRPLRPL